MAISNIINKKKCLYLGNLAVETGSHKDYGKHMENTIIKTDDFCNFNRQNLFSKKIC